MAKFLGFNTDQHNPDFYLWYSDDRKVFFLFPIKTDLVRAFAEINLTSRQAIFFTDRNSSSGYRELNLEIMNAELQHFNLTTFPIIAKEVIDRERLPSNTFNINPIRTGVIQVQDIGWLPHVTQALASVQAVRKSAAKGAPGTVARWWNSLFGPEERHDPLIAK